MTLQRNWAGNLLDLEQTIASSRSMTTHLEILDCGLERWKRERQCLQRPSRWKRCFYPLLHGITIEQRTAQLDELTEQLQRLITITESLLQQEQLILIELQQRFHRHNQEVKMIPYGLPEAIVPPQ